MGEKFSSGNIHVSCKLKEAAKEGGPCHVILLLSAGSIWPKQIYNLMYNLYSLFADFSFTYL